MPAVRNFHLARPLIHRPLSRRELLRKSFLALGVVGAGGALSACRSSDGPALMSPPAPPAPPAPTPAPTPPAPPPATARGRLVEPPLRTTPDENNLLIPEGFTSRVISVANEPVPGTSFIWHTDPDAGAVYPADDGGWVYVSNREFLPGGVNAIRFDAQGEITSAYTVLPGALTKINCGGGVTPWGTWLSGEETDLGYIWECDPFDTTGTNVTRWDGCGTFSHEAAAVDDTSNFFYLTEDVGDGAFYRFVPATPNVGGRPSTTGTLQALKIIGVTQEQLDTGGARGPWPVEWVDIANPNPLQLPELPPELQPQSPTRTQGQALGAHAFDGGEGIWYQNGIVYFTTKGDRRVYAHDVAAQTLEVIYDDFGIDNPIIDSVDNIVMTPGGDIVIVEDKGDPTQQATAIQPDGSIAVLVQLVGQDDSEVTGPAFSPDGRFFYFSSQRGPGAGGTTGTAGITYAIEGPWFTP